MPGELTRIALVDDHKLFRSGLRNLIELVGENYKVIFEADNGMDMQVKITENLPPPEIILMDVNMPGMDGFVSVRWLSQHFPSAKVLVVSMIDREESVIRMLKLGVKGYLSKDVEPAELSEALESVRNKGYYYTDFITGKLVHSIQRNPDEKDPEDVPELTDREYEFVQLACSEMTYQEIANAMHLSNKTVDGYRTTLFEKTGVKNRTGLVLYALRNGLAVL
jgi:two-component system, NarL family, invasion response regulator UvrY